MREIRFLLFTIAVLVATGILIVSCSTPTPTPTKTVYVPMPVQKGGKTLTTMIPMSVVVPPRTNRYYQVMWDAPTNTVGMWVPASKPKDPLAPILVVFQSVVIWPDHYRLEVETSDSFHTLADNIKTNYVLVAASNMPPVCALRVIAVGNGVQSPASTEVYRGVFSNGGVVNMGGSASLVFVAESNKTYTVSNSPIDANRWRLFTNISGRSGLTAIPLPGNTGAVWWTNR